MGISEEIEMIIKRGVYTTDNSDLKVTVHSVRYQCKIYVTFRATLSNKKNGIEYEHKNYKVFKRNIGHWRFK